METVTHTVTVSLSLSRSHTRLHTGTYLPLLDVVPEVFELFEAQFARAITLHIIKDQYTAIWEN